jgi:amidase
MLALGPIVRSVADLQLLLPVLAGRDIRDPRSVDAPLVGPVPAERAAAIVTSLPGATLPASALSAIHRAAELLQAAGWEVEEVTPPDLQRVLDVFACLLAGDARVLQRQLEPFVSDSLLQHLQRLADIDNNAQLSDFTLHTERSRLTREWSQFFAAYPVLIGPNLATPIWPLDADLNPATGIQLIGDATRFIAPANVLGFPSLALPMGLVDNLPTSILIQADLWREDLCLDVARLLEAQLPANRPVDVRAIP